MKLTRAIFLALALVIPATATLAHAQDKAPPAEGDAKKAKKSKKPKKGEDTEKKEEPKAEEKK